MKLLAFLFFVNSICLAQVNVTVKNEAGEQLTGVSVFEISTTNSLLSISDSVGVVSIHLQEHKDYLFHLLGYVDRTLSYDEIKKQPNIVLQNNVYQLNEVVVNKTKLKKNTLVNKPGNFGTAEVNSIKITFERVVPITINKSGFLSEFRLYAGQNFDGEVRVFSFILLSSNDGKPGNSLIGNTVKGVLKRGKMIFNLDTLGIFLEKGDYFIGYETQNNGKIDSYARKIKSKSGEGFRLQYPMIFIKGNIVASPRAFWRNNLKDWHVFESILNKDKELGVKKYIDLAYELEMLVSAVN